MSINKTPCLYCQTENAPYNNNCSNCGMPLPEKHPENKQDKLQFFSKVFWAIAIFCLIMMIYLPR